MLFTVWGDAPWRTAILSLDTGRWRILLDDGAAARYVPTGHLVYAQMSRALAAPGLLAAPFDLERREVTGASVSVLDYPGLNGPNFAVSPGGTLVYVAEGSAWATTSENMLVWVDRTGQATPMDGRTGNFLGPRFSPDGSRFGVANFTNTGTYDIWIYESDRETGTRLTREGHINNFPVWSPDGAWVAFNSSRTPPGIYRKRADGSGTAERLVLRNQHPQIPGDWSPDGEAVLFTELNPETGGDLWLLPPGAEPAPLLVTPHDESAPRLSPDGRALAYVSDVSGRREVYVRRYPGSGAAVRVSNGGGREPAWAPDGQSLFFRRADEMWTASVTTSPEVAAGAPRRLFEGSYAGETFGQPNYDVAPDGRFLMIRERDSSKTVRLHVVTNWFTELARRTSGES